MNIYVLCRLFLSWLIENFLYITRFNGQY